MRSRALAVAAIVLTLLWAAVPADAQDDPGPVSGPPDAAAEPLDPDAAPADVPDHVMVPDGLGAEDGVPLGFVTPDGAAGGVGAVGGIGIPLALTALDGGMPGSAPVTDDYIQATQLMEQQNLARRALEAAERARREAEQRRIDAARNRPDRVPDDVPFAALYNDAAAVHSLDPRMLAAVAKVSSGFKERAGCPSSPRRGLMGLDASVAASYGADPCQAASSVSAAALMMRGLYERYANWDLALGAYRAGAAEVDRTRKVPGSAAAWVRSVDQAWEQYKNPPRPAGDSGDSTGYARPPKGAERTSQGPNGAVCTRRAAGITVACHVAPNVEAMVAAAAADGVRLSGGGYRDSKSQITLRRAHCGPSQYDIYEKPSNQCRPPTARPGKSMHERGEAIDFNNCSSRSTACHQWLKRRAAQFGYYNLPSEPWHWSTNGN